jgi:hypothetical protein
MVFAGALSNTSFNKAIKSLTIEIRVVHTYDEEKSHNTALFPSDFH